MASADRPPRRAGSRRDFLLDAVPDPGGTPRQGAEANKQYAVGVLGLRL
jgi:hypothetical protein